MCGGRWWWAIRAPSRSRASPRCRVPGRRPAGRWSAERLQVPRATTVTHSAPAMTSTVAPEQVVAALFEQAWTIVHIAAHGVVDYEHFAPDGTRRKDTGIVLGGGLFLGPAILDQLPVVPSIMFVNCCHVGRIDPAAEAMRSAQLGRRPNLAASVAVQLVRMGVRGVVAAGWAVDDINAGRFATGFYDAMLGGQAFGDAVRAARQGIYREGSEDTTWGAYQCYGEPDWRLVGDGARGGGGQPRSIPSVAEAVATAEQIREAAQVGLNRDHAGLRAELDQLNQARRRNPALDQPELQVALAEAYGELGSLQKAVRYYRSAIAARQGVRCLARDRAARQPQRAPGRARSAGQPEESRRRPERGGHRRGRCHPGQADGAWPGPPSSGTACAAAATSGWRPSCTATSARRRWRRCAPAMPRREALALGAGRSGLLPAAHGGHRRDPRAACDRRQGRARTKQAPARGGGHPARASRAGRFLGRRRRRRCAAPGRDRRRRDQRRGGEARSSPPISTPGVAAGRASSSAR